jgi:hypothetical protein
MQRAIAVLKIPRRNNDRIAYARSIVAAMTGNPHFPSPTPRLADVQAHIDAADRAQAQVLIGPIGTAALRDARLAAVRSDLEQLRSYVQRIADAHHDAASEGSPHRGQHLDGTSAAVPRRGQHWAEAKAIIESAGMSVKRPGLHDKQPLVVKAGPAAGSVVVVAMAAGDRATYEWQYSRVGEPWIDLQPTRQAKTAVYGLVQGHTYQFRVRSVTKAGRSDFGQVVSFLVL